MSENVESDENENNCDGQDQVKCKETNSLCNMKEHSINEVVYGKHQLLVERANNTFQELCKSLENERIKLTELEGRRKKLQEEMLRLKAEIEDEQTSFNSNIIQSVTENLTALNNVSSNSDKVCDQTQKLDEILKLNNVYTYYEEGENNQAVTVRNLSGNVREDIVNEDITIREQ